MSNEFIYLLLTGAAGAAGIKLLDNVIQWFLNRKAAKEDAQGAAETAEQAQLRTVQDGLRVLLLDRIQRLCREYIKAGNVDFDDRRRLHMMHEVYRSLDGNGDLNALMNAVDELPIS